jgi:hypothetical protein
MDRASRREVAVEQLRRCRCLGGSGKGDGDSGDEASFGSGSGDGTKLGSAVGGGLGGGDNVGGKVEVCPTARHPSKLGTADPKDG